MFIGHTLFTIKTHAVGRKPIDMTAISEELGGPQATIAGPALDLDLYFQQMSERTQMLKSYWDARKGVADELPCICDIELMDIYEIAPYIALVDLAAKDSGFKNRYWGENSLGGSRLRGQASRSKTICPRALDKSL